MSARNDLEDRFPGLKSHPYEITSPWDPTYNCIAWAAEDNARWWEPDPMGIYYWPAGVPRSYATDAYVAAYETIGYVTCADRGIPADGPAVALFAKAKRPTHAARQVLSGLWTSKLGSDVDIEHELRGLEGELYGEVSLLMERR